MDRLNAKRKMNPDEIGIEPLAPFPDVQRNQPPKNNENTDSAENYIPDNFAVRHLVWPATQSSIILLGVDRRDGLHGSFLQDFLQKSTADLISIQIPPDEPYFIRTNEDYKTAWVKFIRGKFDSRFLVNPNPQYLVDLILDNDKVKMLLEGPIMQTTDEFEVGSTFIYSKTGLVNPSLVVDTFLSPLLFAYNNPERKINFLINDVPTLLHRDFLTKVLSKVQLTNLLQQYTDSMSDKEFKFDPKILLPEAFVFPKVAYLVESLRQACLVSKKIIAIVDYNFVDMIEEDWVDLKPQLRSLQSCMMPPLPKDLNLTYVDYIEKLVLLDLITDEYVRKNFVKHKSFPFHGQDTVGWQISKGNIFTIWDHHYKRHAKLVNTRPLSMDEVKMGSRIVTDFDDTQFREFLANRAKGKFNDHDEDEDERDDE